MSKIEEGWKEEGHEPETPPSFFAGRPQEILERRFDWEGTHPGDRIILIALDAETEEPGKFCFEILGKRPRSNGMGDEILIKFIEGSDEFHFHTYRDTCTIPLDSEGLIGVCRDRSLFMLDLGGMSLGRDLTFEEVEGLPEEAEGSCFAHKILDGHHLVPDQPPKIIAEEIEESFSLKDARRRSQVVLKKALGIQEEIKEGDIRLELKPEDVADLDKNPNFNLYQPEPEVERAGLAIWKTSLPGIFYQKQWLKYEIRHQLVIRSTHP